MAQQQHIQPQAMVSIVIPGKFGDEPVLINPDHPLALGGVTPSSSTGSYSGLKKAELVALAEERELDASGTRDDIIARLQEADEAEG